MEWIGWLCFCIILAYSSYPGRVKKLEKKVRKLEKKKEGGNNSMSNMIKELVGKECKIFLDDDNVFSELSDQVVQVVEVDEEWMKISYADKKKNEKTKIMRIEDIQSVEIM